MATHTFITRFKDLHDKAKRGTLIASDRPEYERSRTELGRLLLVAQQMGPGGRTLRSTLRIAQLVKVEIDFGDAPIKSTTMDLASGGFAVLLGGNYSIGREATFAITLPTVAGGGTSAITGTAKVASSRPQGGLWRVSFAFHQLALAAREHLEVVIIDSVLSRFNDPR